MILMDFPADGIELRVLLEVTSKRLGIPILYDDTITGKKVIVRAPQQVPEGALMGILQSALRMKGLALVDAEQPGWKQVVPAANIASLAKPTTRPGETVSAVTMVIPLSQADPARIIEAARSLLTQPGGNIQALSGQKAIVVTDYSSVVQRIAALSKLIDDQSVVVETQFVPLKEAEAQQVSQTLSQLLAVQPEVSGASIQITPDERLNQIVLTGPPDRLANATDLIHKLDRSLQLETHVYHLSVMSPDRLERLLHDLVGQSGQPKYQASVDRETGTLVVSASAAIHAQLGALVKELDVQGAADQNPLRFYKLKNTKATDVLATLSGLLGGSESTSIPESVDASPPPALPGAGGRSALGSGPTASNPTANSPIENPTAGQLVGAGSTSGTDRSTGMSQRIGGAGLDPRDSRYADAGVYPNTLPPNAPASAAVHGKAVTVAADVNTNSIIVIADPQVQQRYADLIKRLDARRPQVQIECTIVTLDTSSNFELAVDIAKLGGVGASKLLTFSSFGVSEVAAASGTLGPVNSRGGTFALLNPGIADVVIRALQQSARSRLVSAPQLLVNDNGRGELQSVAQEPFSEILDTNNTQSRTGLGGQAQAGTTITVEPHISEDDYLQLAYTIELSNFTGTGRSGLPPPSQKNSVSSSVTIPDGYTIVVGGLSVKNLRQAVDTIPILGDIPILKYLIGARSKNSQDTTLFVFIHPVILRDDQFKDLMYLSEKKADAASLPGDYPASSPLPLR